MPAARPVLAALPVGQRGVGRSGPAELRGANPWGCRTRSARSVRASKTQQRGSVFGRRLFCFPGAGTRLPSAPAVSAELRCACAGRERMAAERCWHGSARSRPGAGAAFAGLQRDPAWIAVLLLLLSVTHASLLPGERRCLRSLQSGP